VTIYPSRTVSVSIDRGWHEVYAFLAVPSNFAPWAAGLGAGLERQGDEWAARGPDGPIRIRFTPHNELGVLDHRVIAASGAETLNPMRVMANGTGSEVAFTLFCPRGMSAAAFDADAAAVARDLQALKALLEG
jgi:hypothetical protein